MNKLCTLAVTASILLSASCSKPTPAARTTCTSGILAYTAPTTYDTGICSLGVVNEASAIFSPLGTFSSCLYSTQAAYNTTDNCYYAFKTLMGDGVAPAPLYKITASGAVSMLTYPTGNLFSSLTYNSATGSLYAISSATLLKITTTATSFFFTSVATPVHPFPFSSFSASVPLTVDNTTGDMYYITGDTTNTFVEKYHPGSGTSTVGPVTGAWQIMGLHFNKNDNKLYAIRQDYPGSSFSFIKIDPAGGAVTVLATLTTPVNSDFYSTCLDPCSNRYLFSTLVNAGTGANVLVQLSMTGAVVQHDTTAGLLQGLTAN